MNQYILNDEIGRTTPGFENLFQLIKNYGLLRQKNLIENLFV